jgi:hypothetical protein
VHYNAIIHCLGFSVSLGLSLVSCENNTKIIIECSLVNYTRKTLKATGIPNKNRKKATKAKQISSRRYLKCFKLKLADKYLKCFKLKQVDTFSAKHKKT